MKHILMILGLMILMMTATVSADTIAGSTWTSGSWFLLAGAFDVGGDGDFNKPLNITSGTIIDDTGSQVMTVNPTQDVNISEGLVERYWDGDSWEINLTNYVVLESHVLTFVQNIPINIGADFTGFAVPQDFAPYVSIMYLHDGELTGYWSATAIYNVTDYAPPAPACTPSWVCDGYADCQSPDLTSACNSAFDENVCNESYSGDYTEFSDQACVYDFNPGLPPGSVGGGSSSYTDSSSDSRESDVIVDSREELTPEQQVNVKTVLGIGALAWAAYLVFGGNGGVKLNSRRRRK